MKCMPLDIALASFIVTTALATVGVVALILSLRTNNRLFFAMKRSSYPRFDMEDIYATCNIEEYFLKGRIKLSGISLEINNTGGKHALITKLQVGIIYRRYFFSETVHGEEIPKRIVPPSGTFNYEFDAQKNDMDSCETKEIIISRKEKNEIKKFVNEWPHTIVDRIRVKFKPVWYLAINYRDATEEGDERIADHTERIEIDSPSFYFKTHWHNKKAEEGSNLVD